MPEAYFHPIQNVPKTTREDDARRCKIPAHDHGDKRPFVVGGYDIRRSATLADRLARREAIDTGAPVTVASERSGVFAVYDPDTLRLGEDA